MMTTPFSVSHIMLGVSPDSQNKHKVKSPLSTSADVALVDGASMSQSRPKNMGPHNSQQLEENNTSSSMITCRVNRVNGINNDIINRKNAFLLWIERKKEKEELSGNTCMTVRAQTGADFIVLQFLWWITIPHSVLVASSSITSIDLVRLHVLLICRWAQLLMVLAAHGFN